LIPLWRNKPITVAKVGADKFSKSFIFPSGRQALTYCLQHAGLGRKDRIALPEWSSHCVISAVGRVATPIPIQEVVKQNLKVQALLIYDQWGWPVFSNCYKEIHEKFSKNILIHDMVDSIPINGNFDNEGGEAFYKKYRLSYKIYSLSKTLGLRGGALVKANNQWQKHDQSKIDIELLELLESGKLDLNHKKISSFLKFNINTLTSQLIDWIKVNDLAAVYKREWSSRIKNINLIIESSVIDNWPQWMKRVLNSGHVPGIIPLMKDCKKSLMIEARKAIKKDYNIETTIYHFDWNGNPINPDYNICLAVPIHGMVKNINQLLDAVSQFNN